MRIAWSLTALLLAGAAAPQDDPLLKPVEADYAARWLVSQPPTRIFGNSYLVGFRGLNVGLIRTSAGLILIDGALPQGVREIEANLATLGFQLRDVKLILSTEPHYDHASGIAALARDTGATVVASAAAAPVLMSGGITTDDPQAAWLAHYPPVPGVRVVRDGAVLRLGDTAVTARATPGHTPGSMSWTWRSCEGQRCLNVVFASSLNPIAADGWRFSDPRHAGTVAAFRRTFATLRRLPCDVLMTPHPDQSGGDVKFVQLQRSRTPNPFVDAGACRGYADRFEQVLDAKLAAKG